MQNASVSNKYNNMKYLEYIFGVRNSSHNIIPVQFTAVEWAACLSRADFYVSGKKTFLIKQVSVLCSQ